MFNLFSQGAVKNADATEVTRAPVYSVSGEIINVVELVSLISREDLEVTDSSQDRVIEISDDHINRYSWNFSRFRNACDFTSDYYSYEKYGPFPDIDEAFRNRHLLFEMRLCIRKIFRSTEPEILYSTDHRKMENEIIAHAKFCGYDQPSVFEQFARVYSYLGIDNLNQIDYFVCKKGYSGVQTNIESILGIQVRNYMYYIDVFGSRDLADKYLKFERKVYDNFDREIEEYLKTPEGQAQAIEIEWLNEFSMFHEEMNRRWQATERHYTNDL
ncbi:hypothetical protein O4H49_04430 [Kiloniella laminariae]|uniref:Uncharacterized protein n=1 Tax=Kiloniella laminariae TaxID=454162 RepID=A0ABT4LFY8_9PROT|nr:hypothetical protein [Kiloniella laminariae]